MFRAGTVVLAGGSIESPKLLRRSSMFPWLPRRVKHLVGRGLTDHPTSNELAAFVTHIGNVADPEERARQDHLLLARAAATERRDPLSVQRRDEHQPRILAPAGERPRRAAGPGFSTSDPSGPSRLDIKFSFGNCLDDGNEIRPPPIRLRAGDPSSATRSWMDHLRGSRFPALAGWQKDYRSDLRGLNESPPDLLDVLPRRPVAAREQCGYGQNGHGFGWGTVHHAAGSLRMPCKPRFDARLRLQFRGRRGLCASRARSTLRLRHVGDAVQLGRQPGPHAGRPGAAALPTPGLNSWIVSGGDHITDHRCRFKPSGRIGNGGRLRTGWQ